MTRRANLNLWRRLSSLKGSNRAAVKTFLCIYFSKLSRWASAHALIIVNKIGWGTICCWNAYESVYIWNVSCYSTWCDTN